MLMQNKELGGGNEGPENGIESGVDHGSEDISGAFDRLISSVGFSVSEVGKDNIIGLTDDEQKRLRDLGRKYFEAEASRNNNEKNNIEKLALKIINTAKYR